MAALLLNVGEGDEVIVPSYTFVSTANAFALRGAKIVYSDIRPDTLNLDEQQLESLVTSKTKAVVPVHYAGVGCEMDVIVEIAARNDFAVIEDNAHGLFGKYKGQWLGSFGSLATQSFHETKNFSCGEGGALLINDKSLIDRAYVIREKGTNRKQFFQGQVDKYTWVDLGSSYVMSDILGAFLSGQLRLREEVMSRRCQIWENYKNSLSDWAGLNEVRLPVIPSHCQQAYHLFYLLLPSLAHRQALIQHLKIRGISAVFHYQPLHLSEFGKRCGRKGVECPVSEDVSDRLLRLPMFYNLSDCEQERVIEAIREFEV